MESAAEKQEEEDGGQTETRRSAPGFDSALEVAEETPSGAVSNENTTDDEDAEIANPGDVVQKTLVKGDVWASFDRCESEDDVGAFFTR